MPPVTPSAIRAIVRLGGLGQLLDLVPQDLALCDGHLLLARLAGQRTAQQLPRAGAGDDDEFETAVFGSALHDVCSSLCCCSAAGHGASTGPTLVLVPRTLAETS